MGVTLPVGFLCRRTLANTQAAQRMAFRHSSIRTNRRQRFVLEVFVQIRGDEIRRLLVARVLVACAWLAARQGISESTSEWTCPHSRHRPQGPVLRATGAPLTPESEQLPTDTSSLSSCWRSWLPPPGTVIPSGGRRVRRGISEMTRGTRGVCWEPRLGELEAGTSLVRRVARSRVWSRGTKRRYHW
jgi:hypothetical protein